MGIPGQDRGERVALSMIVVSQAVIRLRGGYIAREVEDTGGIVRLPEVIEENALLPAEFDRMSSFYPLQTSRVTE